MRRIQIKIWPEIESQIPALIPLDRISTSKINPIDIDFTNTSVVNSSGLNILLIILLKLVSDIPNNNWDCKVPKSEYVDNLIKDLNFYKLLTQQIPNQNLFWQNESLHKISQQPILKSTNSINIKLFPIYQLNLKGVDNKREVVDMFKKHLIDNLFYMIGFYDFKLNIFIQMLTEMAKNSADHTDGNAYFGLDIQDVGQELVIKFSFGDLGVGINQRIREYIKNDTSFKNKAKHLAITDSYQWALKVGTTTKPNSGINRGIGMTTIFELSKQLQIKLSVFDAESRGLLSNALNNTHSELRKIFYNIGFKVGFYYFGETKIAKK